MRYATWLAAGLALALLVQVVAQGVAAPISGHDPRVAVGAPTRLDWTFAVATQSLPRLPAKWGLDDYDSKKQTYELYVPPRKDRKKALPVILFVSAGSDPGGWKSFERICKSRGILFAAPRGAGNDCPGPKRVRIVLDVLDDVRRNYPTDPDRTYITGFSGGARAACAIAFALPELFGGAMPLCAAGDLREEPWLRHRVIDRLSVALLTGTTDFNRSEVERFRGPMLKGVGVRTRIWVQPGLGHGVPSVAVLSDALTWLEQGAAKRRELAKAHPASRMDGNAAPDREVLAMALLAEGSKKLAARPTLYAGLMQVQGVSRRWPDTAAGKDARALLSEYEEKREKPWEADDIAEQRRFLVARARALDAYGSGPLSARYAKQRSDMLKAALALWEKVAADSPDSAAGKEAKKRIPVLRKLVEKK